MIGFFLLSLSLFSLQGRFSGERQGSVLIHSILCSVQNNSGIVLCFYHEYVLYCTLQPSAYKYLVLFCISIIKREGKCRLVIDFLGGNFTRIQFLLYQHSLLYLRMHFLLIPLNE